MPEIARQNKASTHFMLAYNIIFASIVGILTLYNLLFILLRRRSLRQVAREQTAIVGSSDPEKVNYSTKVQPPPAVQQKNREWGQFLSWCYRPLWRGGEDSSWAFGASLTPIKIGIILFLVAINLGFLLGVSTMVHGPRTTQSNVAYYVCLRAGHMAVAQAPLVFALTGRNSVVPLLTGFGYQETRFVHKCVASAWILLAVVHFLGMTLNALVRGGRASVHELFAQAIIKFGILAICALVLIGLFSLAVVRKRQYEFFLITHLALAACILAGVSYHAEEYRSYVYISVAFWAFNRLSMFLQVFVSNLFTFSPTLHSPLIKANATYSHGAIILRVPFPTGNWSAGQHAYIAFWDKSVLGYPNLIAQPHPFSIANIPIVSDVDERGRDHEMLFVMREKGGMTKSLAKRLAKTNDTADLWVSMEGPYGHPHPTEYFHEVLFVAGGSGITHIMSMLADVMHKAKLGKSASADVPARANKVKLIWILQSIGQTSWLRKELFGTVQRAHAAGVELTIAVYVTRGPLTLTPSTSQDDLVSVEEFIGRRDVRQNSVDSSNSATHILGGPTNTATTGTQLDELLQHAPTASMTSVHSGRPPMEEIIRIFVEEACGESLVAACGPTAVTSQVRFEVARVRSAHRVSLDIASYEA